MNTTTYMIAGGVLIIVGVVGLYHIREAPGLALLASMGLLGGLALIGKATNKF